MESLFFLETIVKDRQREVRDGLKQLQLEQSLKELDINRNKRRFLERFFMKGGDLLISMGLKLKSCC